MESSEEEGSLSPPESGSGGASPAPALTSDDRKRDKVNSNGSEYRHNECCWLLLWRYKINDAIITAYCYNTHTFIHFIQPPPLSSICKVKSSGLLLNGICLSPICYANAPLSPLISSETSPDTDEITISLRRIVLFMPLNDI